MAMKHYVDPQTNELYGYEADGSQDDWIKPGLMPVSDERAEEIRQANIAKFLTENPVPEIDPVDRLKEFLRANPDVQQLLNGG